MLTPTILVTGGAGYVGSHTVLALADAGYRVVVVDNLTRGHREAIEELPNVTLIVGDVGDRGLMRSVFADHNISTVMHFAAYAYVGESVQDPAVYYRNNVVATLNLLDAMLAAGVKRMVFSSTCATYGIPHAVPILEDHPQHPISPYGATKLMVERILEDYDAAYGLRSVVYRYFNAAGADPKGRSGERHDPETHLIPLVLQAAAGERECIPVLGTDYPTADGTCIRDYVHVCDIAEAHLLGLRYIESGKQSDRFNLGNGHGHSVREVVAAARRVTGRSIPTADSLRREGDPPRLVASAAKANRVLGWRPRFSDIDTILGHSWAWYRRQGRAE